MKKMYLKPEFEVTLLLTEDILSTSNEDLYPGVTNESTLDGDGLYKN